MTYLNDWIILPFFVLGWFPIIYFMRVTSIPEYFERRFDRKTRVAAIVLILFYMIGYVGIILYPWKSFATTLKHQFIHNRDYYCCHFCHIYACWRTNVCDHDGSRSGICIVIAGFVLLYLGISHIGGTEKFIDALPYSHRFPLANFNKPAEFNFAGIFCKMLWRAQWLSIS